MKKVINVLLIHLKTNHVRYKIIKHEIFKEILDHGLDDHLREVMLKLHKHLMKIHAHHNLQVSNKLTIKSEELFKF